MTNRFLPDFPLRCRRRAPQDSFFNVVPVTAPTFAIWVKAGVKLDAATSPLLVNVQCVDDRSPANIITETFTCPLLDKPPTFVTGIPGTSPSISDSTVTATSLGVFTVTDPDTTCSITSVYEIRPVTTPADLQKPEFQVWVSAAVTQASIDFNDQAVPLPLTITCTDGNTAITGTFNVNIVDEPPVISVLPAIGTAINDGLQTVATILHTFSVTDSDDAVNCSVRAPQNARFEVVLATSPAFNIRVKAGATLAAADGHHVINVDCTDSVNTVNYTFTQPACINTPPTFVSGMPGSSASISDATVTQTLLGKFTTTDPDTTCSVTSPVASAYEVRKVTSPANSQQPEFEVWIKITVTQASIDFNDQTVPLPLTIKCTDGYVANDITGTFNVNIVDEVCIKLF
ncbi:hypothetical protein DPMN_022868 [Dreissena polymorpha]|uniref:Uncharacterized protein n=1 Tax=Dreissena polymorpha TaxID=45954 RepID=A0A9D4NPZ4_DREPO|nr:hypothetical protein DPMN_022868 [Dreissena polymorpha]